MKYTTIILIVMVMSILIIANFNTVWAKVDCEGACEVSNCPRCPSELPESYEMCTTDWCFGK